MSDDRIMELEIKLAFQDDLIAKLNDCVIELRAEVDQLGRRLRRYEEQLQASAEEPANERPPHY
jgi:SlyX protein